MDIVTDQKTVTRIYHKLIDERKFTKCFPFEVMGTKKFERYMLEQSHLYACYYSGELVGIAWINRWEQQSARLSFCPFDTINLRIVIDAITEAARRLIHLQNYESRYIYSSLVGIISSKNRVARRIAEKVGMKSQGIIPGYFRFNPKLSHSAHIYTLTREDLTPCSI